MNDTSHETSKANRRALTRRTGFRLVISVIVGVLAAFVTIAVADRTIVFDVMTGWTVGAIVVSAWTWLIVRGMNPTQAAEYAREEDPSVAGADATVIIATMASLAGVGLLLLAGKHKTGTAEAVLGTASVVASWFLVHLMYMLRYARQYYGPAPASNGIDFEGGEPDYYDFAYVAFDLGMTYQISDTNLKNRWVTTYRAAAHAAQLRARRRRRRDSHQPRRVARDELTLRRAGEAGCRWRRLPSQA